ncbi:ABC transporter permease [Janthinobacterium sp. 17J80-10]|uniref:ABC transporter permease n=1 Tax=Janthinobacterium sp. 17J80-10 TaxID=2497863 RepID=UPI0010054109|nr:ABC transporter permease [Janthinobacterium sp. 17J80-10]QAU33972.1 ABC transporter permease [Janthinobacterium sp. 17J80-10]
MKHSIRSTFIAALPFVLLLLVWHHVTAQGWYSPKLLVPPQQVWQAFTELLQSQELQNHLGISLQRLAIGLAIGSVCGILFGVAMAASRNLELIATPTFNVVRQVPSVALIPIFILIFGIGETFKLLIIVKASFFTLAVAAYGAVKGVSARYIEVSRAYCLPRRVVLLRILLPATVPDMLTGFRLAVGRSWGSLVAAELLAAEIGIGQMMEFGRQMFRMDVVMVGMLITGLIGFALDRSVKVVERRLNRWRPA